MPILNSWPSFGAAFLLTFIVLYVASVRRPNHHDPGRVRRGSPVRPFWRELGALDGPLNSSA